MEAEAAVTGRRAGGEGAIKRLVTLAESVGVFSLSNPRVYVCVCFSLFLSP